MLFFSRIKSSAGFPNIIPRTTEPLTRILEKHDVTVVNKPGLFTTVTSCFLRMRVKGSVVRGVILGKPAELLIREKKNI